MIKSLFILFAFLPVLCFSQDFGVGTWREHLPYNNVVSIAKIESKTYAATKYALYSIDSEDNNIERLNKINALSDLSINVIQTNSSQNTLVIGYQSGNIDLIKNDKVINLSSIIISNIVGDKTIYNMHNDGQYAYLACGFGIVVVDVKKEEIKDTYIIGNGGSQLKINDITVDNTYIYAATDDGIYKANKNNAFLADFSVWSKDTQIPNNSGIYNLIHSNNNKIYANLFVNGWANDSIYFFDGAWNKLSIANGRDYYSIESKDNGLVMANNYGLIAFSVSHQLLESYWKYDGTVYIKPNHIIWDGNKYLVGDQEQGFSEFINDFDYNNISVSGPFSIDVFQMAFLDDLLWVATGRVGGTNWNVSYTWNGVYIYNQYDWDMVNRKTDDFILQKFDTLFDFVQVTIDPGDKDHVFASSFQGGVIEIQDKKVVNHFTYHNSSLQKAIGHFNNAVRVAGSSFDNEGNFWIANSFVSEPLSVYSDGQWESFFCGSAASETVCTDILVDKTNNYIWMAVKQVGLLVYDYNGTPLDNSDDQYKLLLNSEGNGGLPSKIINTIAEDKDGEIWVGTENGPAVFYNPSAIFDDNSDYDAQQILIEQDGVIQLLLETENIIEIVVDGGDRKWFGTEGGGLFLMSADGTELIHGFTTENSPLFSNNIIALAMNDNTGELYIGTDRGLMGYKGEATEPEDNLNDLYAYPNPVRPEYFGPIAIKGFMEDTDVKITDASGNLVYSTISLGGQAIWDGNNLQGERVKSGVYYCFAVSKTSTQNGFNKASTKILFIN